MKSTELLSRLSSSSYTFQDRPDPVPPDHRLAWRLAALLLVLFKSRGGSASLPKIHYIGNALRTAGGMEAAERVLQGASPEWKYIVRVEPAIGRALDFARGSGLVEMLQGKTYRLTTRGKTIAGALWNNGSVLVEEKDFIDRIRGLATEQRIKGLLRAEVIGDA